MFDHETKGIFKLLDDTIKIQSQNSEIFLQNIFSNWENHSRLTKPKSSETRHNDFIIRHFSGDVQYSAVGALIKLEKTLAKRDFLSIFNVIQFV